MSLRRPSWVSSMFSSLMSRCATPFWCMKRSPATACRKKPRIVCSGTQPPWSVSTSKSSHWQRTWTV